MLNDFLVLGLVPGTNFQITFSDIVAAFCLAYLTHEYLKYAIEIERWFKWADYRVRINYRKQKRHIRSVIRFWLYRLAVKKRQTFRVIKSYLRRRRRAAYMAVFYRPYSSLKRNFYIKIVALNRTERRLRRSRPFKTFLSLKDFVSQPD